MQRYIRKYKVLFSIIICLVTLGISSAFNWDEYAVMGIDKFIGDVLITLLCFGIIQRLNLKIGLRQKGLGRGFVLGIPFIIIGIVSAFIGNIGIETSTLLFRGMPWAVLFTMNMFLVGVNEEILMRGLVLNLLLEKEASVWKAIIISAMIFGAIHIPNLFFMNPLTVTVQTINAAAAGILFAVVYILCKNLWAVIIVHGLVDWLSLFISQCFVGGESVLSIDMNIGQGIMMIILGAAPPIIIALLFMKFVKHKESA